MRQANYCENGLGERKAAKMPETVVGDAAFESAACCAMSTQAICSAPGSAVSRASFMAAISRTCAVAPSPADAQQAKRATNIQLLACCR